MTLKEVSPGALAGATRADVKMPVSKDDIEGSTPTTVDLQLRRLLSRYAISRALARVIAEIAFSGRRA